MFFLSMIMLYVLCSLIVTSCNESCDCMNGGICVDGTCHCEEGFTGPRCQERTCDKPCKNGGECVDGTCKCPEGYTGPDCSTPINACEGIYCQNGGRCENGDCICPPGCFGTYCENCVETQSFLPGPQLRLCPTHTSGDADFAGLGPIEYASAKLFIVNNKEVWVRINLSLKQSAVNMFNPMTEGSGEWEKRLWVAPNGYRIHAIQSDTFSSCSGTDNQHSAKNYEQTSNSLVDHFTINGDTPGSDLGGCLDSDSYLSVYFHTIKVGILPD